MKKKCLIAAFAFVLAAAAFGQNAADFAIDSNGIITKYNGWGAAVVIPETINGIRVTAIGKEAFASNDLTSVTIPRSVTYIGNSAFSNNKLTRVTIPGNGVFIGKEAFSNNPLTSVTLGANHVFGKDIVSGYGSLFYDYVCNDRKAGTYTAVNRYVGKKKAADFEYIETQYGALITSYYGSSGNRLVIPSKLGSLSVKAIGSVNSDYSGYSEAGISSGRESRISRVQIPNSVTYIGDGAFSNNQLTDITIPDSVTYIGEGAFSSNGLTSVSIGNGVTYIGGGAFSRNQLASVTIPGNVTYIDGGAFSYNRLTSVTIPGSVTFIGNFAFSDNQLTGVTIPGSVTTIDICAFAGNKLTSVSIGNGVTYIGGGAFERNQLTGVTIPGSVIYIGESAFAGNKLTSVSIPGSVIYIDNEAFSRNQLASVTIGNSVTHIGKETFSDNQLTSVTIPDSVTFIGERAFSSNQLTSVSIGNSVTTIGNSAFVGNQLTSVTIGNSVTTIGSGAFGENKLTSVTIGANVQMGTSSFGSGFETVYDRNGKLAGTYIRPTANSREWGMATGDFLYIGSTIIGYSGSGGAVTIPSSINGKPVTSIGANAFSGKQLTSVTIPNSVTTIGREAFFNNQLTSVVIPNSVTTIGDSAFYVNQLTSVTIGANVSLGSSVIDYFETAYNDGGKRAGTYTLNGREWGMATGDFLYTGSTITSYTGSGGAVTIPLTINGTPVTSIGANAFRGNNLTSVTIPDSVTSIGGAAFSGNQLTSVTIGANVALGNSAIDSSFERAYNSNGRRAGTYKADSSRGGWSMANGDFLYSGSTIIGYIGSGGAVTIPSAINGTPVTSIGANAFSGNNLTSVTIPDSVTTIGNRAFYNNKLTSVTIPGSVTKIDNRAFDSNQLTSVTIGANVTLGDYAIPYLNAAYDSNSKREGTYTRPNADSGAWTRRRR